jgi:hypothetical protein
MKKIETLNLKPSEIKTDFGNPRKITKEKKEDLQKSIEKLGDFGVIVIDEEHNVISGNQRLEAMKQLNIDIPILCKKLIGYTDAEKKAVNIRANTQSGIFDDDLLEVWLEDIRVELDDIEITGIEDKKKEITEKELNLNILYEIIIECNNEKEQEKYYNILKEEYKCRLSTL